MSEHTQDAASSAKRDTGNLNAILSANYDAATKAAEERKQERQKFRSKPAETEPRTPAEPEPKAKGDDDGQGDAQAKDDEGKKGKAKAAPEPENETETENKAEKREKSAKKPEISDEPAKSGEAEADKTAKAEDKASESAKIDADGPFAPKSWSDEERKAFDEAPADVKKAVAKLVKNLTSGFTKKTTELAEARKLADDVAAAIQPQHKARMEANGFTAGKQLAQFFALEDAFLNSPADYVRGVMQIARLTPEQVFGPAHRPQQADGAQPEGQAPAAVAPEVAALQQELAALKGAWQQATQTVAQRQQMTERARMDDAQTAIQHFGSAVDETGTPLHPLLDKVWPHMLPIINDLNADPERSKLPNAEKLKIAYEDAVWANPDYRRQHQERSQQATQAQIDAAAKAAAAKAAEELERTRAKSAVSVRPRGASGQAAGTDKPRSLDEILRAAGKKHGL